MENKDVKSEPCEELQRLAFYDNLSCPYHHLKAKDVLEWTCCKMTPAEMLKYKCPEFKKEVKMKNEDEKSKQPGIREELGQHRLLAHHDDLSCPKCGKEVLKWTCCDKTLAEMRDLADYEFRKGIRK